MSSGNLSRIENGDQGPPSDEVLERLAAVLETSFDELLGTAGRSRSEPSEVLRAIQALHQEMRDGFARIEARLEATDNRVEPRV